MKKYIRLFLVILFTLIIILSGIGISYLFYLQGKPAYTLNENNEKVFNSEQDGLKYYKNYKYRISYWFGNPVYIYYYDDGTIKVVDFVPEGEICESTNCVNLTGRYISNEKDIKFSNDAKKIVINCFNELYKLVGKKEIDANNYDLTSYQDRIIMGIVLNDETEFNEGE